MLLSLINFCVRVTTLKKYKITLLKNKILHILICKTKTIKNIKYKTIRLVKWKQYKLLMAFKPSVSLRVWLLFIRLELKTSQTGNIKLLKSTFLDLYSCLSTAFQYVWICDSVQYKWEYVWNRNSLALWAAERMNVILIGGSTSVTCMKV